jgi:hypothetical protein
LFNPKIEITMKKMRCFLHIPSHFGVSPQDGSNEIDVSLSETEAVEMIHTLARGLNDINSGKWNWLYKEASSASDLIWNKK